MPPETMYARSGEVNIAYQIVGEGSLDLILVPGWVSNIEVAWEEPRHAYFLRRLASFSRLILFDRRGTGLSDRGFTALTLDERMDDARAVMDAAGVSRAALVGYRGGGPLCALFAATYPERTSALVLFGSYAKRTWAPDYPWGPTPDEHEAFMERLRSAWGTELHAELLAPSAAGDEQFRRWWASYQRLSASPNAALDVARMNARIDVRGILPAIRARTLVLHRSGDREIDAGGSRYMAGQIPEATYIELPGVDHLPWMGDADRVLDEIRRFLVGDAARPGGDRVLLTILVADSISTNQSPSPSDHERWRDRRDTYRDALHRAIERFQGTERGRTGERTLATFERPSSGIGCAQAIVQAASALGITVRIGLHTGECVATDDGVTGVAVEVATRLSARAGPGDIVVSNTVKDLVAGSGVAFVDAGILSDAGTAWRLYRLDRGATGARHGADRLSPREREVASCVARGMSNREIADKLAISNATVERHIANILNKLNYHSRSQIAAWAVEQGLMIRGND